MKKKLLLVALISLSFSAAAGAGGAPVSAPVDADQDLITPLNVRDPSALVMGPGSYGDGHPADVLIETLPPTPVCPDAAEKVESSEFSKDGPKAGKRAVSVMIGEDQLLGVKPGDRVDVLATLTAAIAGEKGSERLTATVLQNVRVLGVARVGSLRDKGVIRLELNPTEAEYAQLVAEQTVLGLEKRAPGDVEIHPMEMSSLRRLFR